MFITRIFLIIFGNIWKKMETFGYDLSEQSA